MFTGDEANLIIPLLQYKIQNILFCYDEQICPPLLLFCQKIIANLFGINEYTMRLIPCCAGILGCILFHILAARFLTSKISILFADFLFCTNMAIFEFSALFKPYIIDVLFAIIILILTKKVILDNYDIYKPKYLLLFTVFSFISFLSSFTSVFLIASLFFCLIIKFIISRNKNIKTNILPAIVLIIINCIFLEVYYIFYLHQIHNWEHLYICWHVDYGFFPNTIRELAQLVNFFFDDATYFGICKNNCLIIASSVLFILGIISFFVQIKQNKENRKNEFFKFLILILPVIIVLIFSLFGLYPFQHRLVLFLLPAIILIICNSIELFGGKNIMVSLIFITGFIISFSVYIFNTQILKIYKNFLKDNTSIFYMPDWRPLYLYMKDKITEDDLLIIKPYYMMQMYVYNHMYQYKPKNIIITGDYPKLLDVNNTDYIISRIKKYNYFYMLEIEENLEYIKELQYYIKANYTCEIITRYDYIKFVKCTYKDNRKDLNTGREKRNFTV